MSILRRTADPKIAWLAEQPWWGGLDQRDLRALAALGDRTTVPAGQWFMHQDEQGREAAVIVTGDVEIVRDGEVIARVGPGEVVGELALLSDHPRRNAGVRSVTDAELLVFSVVDFHRLMHDVDPVRRQVEAAVERHGG